ERRFYLLTRLPYTSGELHVGHWYPMAPSDAVARYHRMRGYEVFYPIGFDAFGLPAENAAIKQGIHPHKWTYANINRMRGQLKSIGAMFDWNSEVTTSDPEYYRWNQWFFLKLYEKGLAYRAMAPVNWCPKDQTVLANEQVLPNGTCERCGTPVIHRDLEQWFLKTTAYANELLDFSKMDWPEQVTTMQRNGTGAVMGVPANDKRDFEFAKKNGLMIPVVIAPPDWDGAELEEAYVELGTMVNSGQFDGLPNEEGKRAIAEFIEEKELGKRTVSYRLRDYLISRQRYWGTPIPMVHCPK